MCTFTIEGKVVHNLTPHTINWVRDDGTMMVIPPCLSPFRLTSQDVPLIQVSQPVHDTLEQLKNSPLALSITLKHLQPPDPLPDVFYQEGICIVSLPALQGLVTAGYRQEDFVALLVAPDTDKGAIRNEKGDIVGTRGFVTLLTFVQRR